MILTEVTSFDCVVLFSLLLVLIRDLVEINIMTAIAAFYPFPNPVSSREHNVPAKWDTPCAAKPVLRVYGLLMPACQHLGQHLLATLQNIITHTIHLGHQLITTAFFSFYSFFFCLSLSVRSHRPVWYGMDL